MLDDGASGDRPMPVRRTAAERASIVSETTQRISFFKLSRFNLAALARDFAL